MIVTLEEAKQYLRPATDEDDPTIQSLIDAAELYLENATGIKYDSTNPLAKLFCKILVADWYENRELTENDRGQKVSKGIRPIVESMLVQLKYCYQQEVGPE